MIPLVVGGLVAGFGLFGAATVRDAIALETKQEAARDKIKRKLQAAVGDYVVITLANGIYKKGYLCEVHKKKVILDTTRPKLFGGHWVKPTSGTGLINEETIALEVVSSVKTLLTKDKMFSYRFV